MRRSEFETAVSVTGKRMDSLRGLELTGAYDPVQVRIFIDSLLRGKLIELHEVEADAFHSSGEPGPVETHQQIISMAEMGRLGMIPRLFLGTDMASSIGRNSI
jgi:hypothetical protein